MPVRGVVVLLAVGLLAACAPLGPASVAVERPAYSVVLQQTGDALLLANLARLRYGDTTSFIDVTGIVSQMTLDVGGEIGTGGSGATPVGVGASATLGQQPTISYAPLQGEAFVQRLLAPLPIDTLVLMLRSGWGARRIFGLAVQSLGGIPNAARGAGPTPGREPAHRAYDRVLDLLTDVYTRGLIDFTYEMAPPSAPIKVGPRMVMEVQPGAEGDAAVRELFALLQLAADRPHYPLAYPSVLGGASVGGKQTSLLIEPRSVLAMMSFLSQGVEPCPDDVRRGVVRTTRDEDAAAALGAAHLLGNLFRVQCATARPSDATLVAQHRGRWFSIADDDLRSRTTFAFLAQVYALQAAPPATAAPILVLPTSH